VRILHVFGTLARGGAELRTIDVMRHLDRSRFELEFCCLGEDPGTLAPDVEALGARVHTCPPGLFLARRFSRLLRERQPDVLHSHVHFFSAYLLRLAAKVGIPGRIAHFRTTIDPRDRTLQGSLRRLVARRWIDRHATLILGVSAASLTANWGEDWSKDPRCRVVYNGIDASRFDPAAANRAEVRRELGFSADALVVFHVGRFDPQKNHRRLVDIFGALLRRVPAARLAMIGRGGNGVESATRARILELGIEREVVLTGEREDVPRLLDAADILLLPSVREGLPGVILEATAAGVPVLASDLPEIREIASQLPSVGCEPLGADDDSWARRASEIIEEYTAQGARERVARAIAGSDFSVVRCTGLLAAAWVEASLAGARR